MSNPYADAAFEVFYEALDAIADAKEKITTDSDVLTSDLELLNHEERIIKMLAGDFRMKMMKLEDENGS